MIMKNGKQIGFIYKNGKKIDKIVRHGKVYFEQGFTREKTSITLPMSFNGINKNLKDYKIYGNTKQQLLPDGYTQVDYIEATGTQYIDTGVYGNLNMSLEIKASRTTLDNTNKQLAGSLGNTYSITINIGSTNITRFGTKSYSMKAYDYIIEDKPSVFICNKNGITIDGKSTGNFNEDTNFTTESTLYLMSANGSNSKFPGKLYYAKIYDNNILVRYFIPCYRDSDNEIGLYDLVNNLFYTNQGSGSFTYGSTTPTPDTPIEIVSCGDLITDSQDENYGKYKIPVNVNDSITNIYLDEPLRKTKDSIYVDYIDFINQKVYRQLGEYQFTDYSDCNHNGAQTNFEMFTTPVINNLKTNIPNSDTSNIMFCNYTLQLCGSTPSSRIRFNIPHKYLGTTQSSTPTEAKQALANFMSGKTMEFVYPLQTPTEEDIELPDISTINGNNTLNIETEITPFQVYIKYKSNN